MKDPKDIWKHLKKTGGGFSCPEGYFDGLDARLNFDAQPPEKDAQGEPGSEAPDAILKRALSSGEIPLDHGFRVPEGYFESLEEHLQVKYKRNIIGPNWNDNWRVISLSIAASLLLFIGLRFYNPISNETNLADLNSEEIENWVEQDLISFNSYEIAEAFDDVEIHPTLDSDEEVLDYLNELDLEILMTEN